MNHSKLVQLIQPVWPYVFHVLERPLELLPTKQEQMENPSEQVESVDRTFENEYKLTVGIYRKLQYDVVNAVYLCRYIDSKLDSMIDPPEFSSKRGTISRPKILKGLN